MRRIEDTAHHPSAGWDPFVGFGVVDPLAALSADGEAAGRRDALRRRRSARPSTSEPADPRRPNRGVGRRGGLPRGGHGRRDAVGGLATTAARARHARLTPRRC